MSATNPFTADPTALGLTGAQVLRFVAQIAAGDPFECWLWCGSVNNMGYGRFAIYPKTGIRRLLAHRIAWALAGGDLAEAPVLRHSCDRPLCCNPAHLSPGTQADNIHDALTRGRMNLNGLTIGQQGRHLLGRRYELCRRQLHRLEESAYYRRDGRRYCGACARERQRALYQAKRVA